ncbi:RTA1 like protein [Apiospora arundinis]
MADDAAAAGTEGEGGFTFKLYRYTPSLTAAIIFVVIFAVLSAVHTWRLLRYRAYYFTAFTIGGYFQLVGYAGRIWSHYKPDAIGGFVMQAILILVAPALYAASIYMILGHLIRTLNASSLSLLPVAQMTKIFVTGDVVSFTLQAGGGGIQSAGTLDLYNLGEKIIIVGLFVQIVVFGFFVVTVILFHRRYVKEEGLSSGDIGQVVHWRRHLWVLYFVCALILIRSIFRVIEYLQGNGGYLISHEAFLYVFDAVLMAIVMAVFAVWYVDNLDSEKEHLSGRDFAMEML